MLQVKAAMSRALSLALGPEKKALCPVEGDASSSSIEEPLFPVVGRSDSPACSVASTMLLSRHSLAVTILNHGCR